MAISHHSINYIPLETVLDDIHSMVPDIDWDEGIFLEWAAKGYRKLNLPAKYEEVVTFIPIVDHVGSLPKDLIHINQMFYKCSTELLTKEESDYIAQITGIEEDKPFYRLIEDPERFFQQIKDATYWFNEYYRPLRKYSGNFGFAPCTQDIPRNNCEHHYVREGCAIRTSFSNGCIILSYKRRVVGKDGLDLIPDDEVLKDALFHFCMYRFWMSRSMSHEQGTLQQYRFHLQMYDHMGKRAVARLNFPDLDQMENLSNYNQRLVPRSNLYDSAFSRLSNRENINF
jgi:hypothetical protein